MRIVVAFLLLALVCSVGYAAEELTEEDQLKTLKKKLELSKQKLLKVKKKEESALGELAVVKKRLKRTQHNLSLTKDKIKSNQSKIGKLTNELSITEGELSIKEKKLAERMSEVYKSSGMNYLEVLISSRSMSDFINRAYFFGKVVEYDSRLVQEIRKDAQKVRGKKALLENKTREIKGLARVFAKKKGEFAVQAEKRNKIYKSLKQRRREYEAQIAELDKSSKQLEVLILKKIAARKGGRVLGSGAMAWPVRGRITSRFGYRRHPIWGGRHHHTGLDIAAKYGTAVKSADSGEVIFSGWWDGYGKAVVVDHGRKTTTVYAHLSRIYKKVGAVVAKGQVIGLVGSTGYSTGAHLHFEVRKNGKPVNPVRFL
jgi:murein DD-endopeptidase MepM/ murein hydrolase activator NlpD